MVDCGDIYQRIKNRFGSNITEPPGLPNIIEFRLINLFTAASTTEMREKVLDEFCKWNTRLRLRLVIVTSAFGLGVDCPDIGQVINWGAPNTVEELVQQSGRAVRDDSQAEAILYYKKLGKHTSKAMEEYGQNETRCRRALLLSNLLFCDGTEPTIACRCCDLCSALCNCQNCN